MSAVGRIRSCPRMLNERPESRYRSREWTVRFRPKYAVKPVLRGHDRNEPLHKLLAKNLGHFDAYAGENRQKRRPLPFDSRRYAAARVRAIIYFT